MKARPLLTPRFMEVPHLFMASRPRRSCHQPVLFPGQASGRDTSIKIRPGRALRQDLQIVVHGGPFYRPLQCRLVWTTSRFGLVVHASTRQNALHTTPPWTTIFKNARRAGKRTNSLPRRRNNRPIFRVAAANRLFHTKTRTRRK